MENSPSSRSCVDERWQAAGDGTHYATDRWKTGRARSRDPRLVDHLIRSLPSAAAPIESVLDVPCGTGRMHEGAIHSVRRRFPGTQGPTWAGVDVSASMLAEATGAVGLLAAHGERPGGEGAVVEGAGKGAAQRFLLRGSASELPFADNAFDLVLCCRLLHHYEAEEHRQAAMGELFRVARHYVIASFWDARSLTAWRRRTTGPLRRRKGKGVRHASDWATIRREVERAGGHATRKVHSMRYLSAQTFFLAEVSRFAT